MKLIHLALLTCLVPLAPSALADTIFNLSGRLETDKHPDHTGDYDHDGVLSGTLTLNSTGTAFDAVHLTYNFNYRAGDFGSIPITFNTVGATDAEPGGITRVRIYGSGSAFDFVQTIDIRTADLSTYRGGAVCGTDFGSDCGASAESMGTIYYTSGFTPYGYSNIESATLSLADPAPVAPVPTAAAPEPASIMLLGTGLLGAAGAIRRRTVG